MLPVDESLAVAYRAILLFLSALYVIAFLRKRRPDPVRRPVQHIPVLLTES